MILCDLLYVAHNRLAFTQATFPALLKNTNLGRVAELHVADDDSTDGTTDYLRSAFADFCRDTCVSGEFRSRPFGGPVAVMNATLDFCETDVLVKIDNDLLLCPGWLDALLDVLAAHPEVDVLGFEPGFGDSLAPADAPRSCRQASHIGGVGAFRRRLFVKHRPRGHDRFFGLTEFQRRYARAAWLTPDLPCPLLDHLPFEPWVSLAAEYVEKGWSRSWPKYPETMSDYWSWAFAETVA